MKELTIEQKAQRYDESVELAAKFKKEYLSYKELNVHKGVIEAFNSIFPELKELEDEKIRKAIRTLILSDMFAWLEKQGEHAKFRDSIQVGDKVTRNQDGVLVNLSQLNRVAKPADKVEPKFKVGDWVIDKQGIVHQIERVVENVTNHTFGYDLVGGGYFNDATEGVRLWTIQDAKDGDVLHCWIDGYEFVLIYKDIKDGYITTYGHLYQNLKLFSKEPTTMFCRTIQGHFTPATKEQSNLLFQKMKEAGYEWDAEKKELKKTEEEFNGKDYGIDSLWHARNILERTLGKVEGYETDDGILEHKCAISAIKQLAKQNNAWSEEDEKRVDQICDDLRCGIINFNAGKIVKGLHFDEIIESNIDWLKSLKDRYT